MDVKFLSASQTQSTLIALVENCESMQWAVAWATENAVFEAAMKDSSKFEHFVVGTHMFQTQPKVLERAAALAAAAVVPPTLREVERGRSQAGRRHSRAQEVSAARRGLRAFREHGCKWDVREPGHRSAHRSLPRPRFHPVDGRGHAGRLRPLRQSVQSSLRSGRASRRTTDRD